MRPLADAARSRAESDWLVGINATRALTSFNSRSGGFQMTAAGRVQTPTLAILAGREEKSGIQTRPYFEVHAEFGVEPEAIVAAGSMRILRKMEMKTRAPERIWGRKEPRKSSKNAKARSASSAKRKSHLLSFRPCSTTNDSPTGGE